MKQFLKQVIHFIWYDNSILSWVINVLIAFLLVKFIIYPAFGFILGTSYPLVAVVSGSMEHEQNFDRWWEINGNLYTNYNINYTNFLMYSMINGFNMGDIIILRGLKEYEVGDVVVYINPNHENPIIHRVVSKKYDRNGKAFYTTKGDNNAGSDDFEVREVVGEAIMRVPLLGWVKIIFSTIIDNLFEVTQR